MPSLSTQKVAAPLKSSPTDGVRLSRTYSAANSLLPDFTPTPIRLQAKLTVNTPGDKYEQEADRVAEQVMRMPEPQLQRQCVCGNTPDSGECAECKKKLLLQRSPAGSSGIQGAPPIVHQVVSSLGRTLDSGTRTFFEPRFGRDLSHVRVHTDPQAAESAKAVGAVAYTVGNNIAFASGAFSPHTKHGRRLLAHELTHVIQQGGSHSHVQRQSAEKEPSDAELDSQLATLSEQMERASERLEISQTPADGGNGSSYSGSALAHLQTARSELGTIRIRGSDAEKAAILQHFQMQTQKPAEESLDPLAVQRSSSSSSDQYEQEANRIADAVTNGAASPLTPILSISRFTVQKVAAAIPIALGGGVLAGEAAGGVVAGGIAAGPPGWVLLAVGALALAGVGIYLASRRGWTCSASCNVQEIVGAPRMLPCPPRVTGSGSGPDQVTACLNAKRDATQKAPPGCYPRHCQCSCSH